MVDLLHNDVVLRTTLSFLPMASLLRFERVCKAWRHLIQTNRELQLICFRRGFDPATPQAIYERDSDGFLEDSNVEFNPCLKRLHWLLRQHPSFARLNTFPPGPGPKELPFDRHRVKEPDIMDTDSLANELSCKNMYITRPPIRALFLHETMRFYDPECQPLAVYNSDGIRFWDLLTQLQAYHFRGSWTDVGSDYEMLYFEVWKGRVRGGHDFTEEEESEAWVEGGLRPEVAKMAYVPWCQYGWHDMRDMELSSDQKYASGRLKWLFPRPSGAGRP